MGPATRIAFVCGTAFVLLASYALARPTIESLFIAHYGTRNLPWVWVAVMLATMLVVLVYNRHARARAIERLLSQASLLSAASLSALLLVRHGTGASAPVFALYMWKDIYIVVLLEALWSFANVVFTSKTARWLYGLLLLCGSVGGISGNLLAGRLAEHFGTERAIWAVVVVLLILGVLTRWAPASAAEPSDRQPPANKLPALADALALLRSSRYLGWLMALVGTVQIAITLVDYQFNWMLEHEIADVDERTAVLGYVYAAVDASAGVLQLLAGLVLRYLGVGVTLLTIPGLLLGFAAAFWLLPTVSLVATLKTASKALDYSLFKAGKELLYIPLSYDEKTRGKALVDMFTYRSAKAIASLMLLILGAVTAHQLIPVLVLVIAIWLGVTAHIVRTRRSHSSKGEV